MTSFEILIDRCLHKIEKDPDLFSYYNVSASEAEILLREQIVNYIPDAIDKIYESIIPDVNLYDYDMETQKFNIELTNIEIGLISTLMAFIYYDRQKSLLGAFKLRMSPSDVNTINPKSERDSFMNMYNQIAHEADLAIAHYASVNRNGNEQKYIDHSQFDYDS